ncbi:hypothetical protein V6N12_011286 [Hibiscus sabdariffa]|uniref:DUF4283 domain-containing protein n=1 Tax=Hibiscus sabdariffa TaxID=183260 RepID=A0ABR2EMM2_9ROSI
MEKQRSSNRASKEKQRSRFSVFVDRISKRIHRATFWEAFSVYGKSLKRGLGSIRKRILCEDPTRVNDVKKSSGIKQASLTQVCRIEDSNSDLMVQVTVDSNIHVDIPTKDMIWISRCLAGKIKTMYNPNVSKDLLNLAWKIKEQTLDPWFDFVEPLAYSEKQRKVKVWASLEEVPLCIWHSSFFSRLGNAWESLIEVDKSTIARESFESAKLLLMVEKVSDIPSSITVMEGLPREDNSGVGDFNEPEEGGDPVTNQTISPINNQNTRDSSGQACYAAMDQLETVLVGLKPTDSGLHEVHVINMAFLDSDTSSLCLRNEKGVLISGMGIPNLTQSPSRYPKRRNSRKIFVGSSLSSPWSWLGRNSSSNLRNDLNLGKRKQIRSCARFGSTEEGASGDGVPGTSNSSANSEAFAQSVEMEAANTLETFVGATAAQTVIRRFGVVGSILIVMGLYSVLWGKHKESKEKENEMEMEDEPIKAIRANGNTTLVIGDIEANRVLQLQKNEANEKLSNNGMARSSSTLP